MSQKNKPRDVWDQDFQDLNIDDPESADPFDVKHRGSLRLKLGLYYTEEEYDKTRKKILKTPLP